MSAVFNYLRIVSRGRMRDSLRALKSIRRTPGHSLSIFALAGGSFLLVLCISVLLHAALHTDDLQLRIWELICLHQEDGEVGLSATQLERVEKALPSAAFAVMGVKDRPVAIRAHETGPVLHARALAVSWNYLYVLTAFPVAGRDFRVSDAYVQAGAPPPILVGQRFIRRQLGGDSSIVGRSLSLDGIPHRVIGVLPEGITRLHNADVLSVLPQHPFDSTFRGVGLMRISKPSKPRALIAFLQPVLVARWNASDVQRLLLEPAATQTEAPRIVAEPLLNWWLGDRVAGILLALVSTVGACVVALAAAAGIFLSRASARRTELATRAALGAGRGELLRELDTEFQLLTAGAFILSLTAVFAVPPLLSASISSEYLTISGDDGFGMPYLLWPLALMMAMLPLIAVPSWQITSDLRLAELLRSGSLSRIPGRPSRVARRLAVFQVAGAFFLLTMLLFAGWERLRAGPKALLPAATSATAMPTDHRRESDAAIQRLTLSLASGAGLFAGVLSVFAVSQVMSLQVQLRTPEIGLRMALGADAQQTARLIRGEALALTRNGIFLGLPLFLLVFPIVPGTSRGLLAPCLCVMGAAGVTLGAAWLACIRPTRRAARIDPAEALRDL